MVGCAHTSVKPVPNTAVLVNYGTLSIPPQETPLAVSNDFTETGTYYVWAKIEDDRCKVWFTDFPPP
jgi:hypothetical protein